MRRSAAPVYAIAAAAFAAHAATLGRYGFYRDELYFLACVKRFAWGFVDQPPLVPAFAALGLVTHDALFGVRIIAALAAAATVIAAATLARELGAGRFGQVVTALAVALMPGSLFLGNTLTTTSLEPLTWTLAIFFVLRCAHRGGYATVALLAFTIAAAAYMKYSILLLAGALTLGALITRSSRTALVVVTASVCAAALLLPNILWQASHGFPMLAVLHGDVTGRHAFNAGAQYEFAGPLRNAPAFLLEQLAFPGPLSAPLWIAGVLSLLGDRRLRDARFIGAAYVLVLAAGLVTAAKGYYVIGIYPALFAAGAVVLERQQWRIRTPYAVVLAAAGLVLAPVTLPVLPVDGLIAYMHAFGAPKRLMQPLFADEFGWEDLTRTVAVRYEALPENVRAKTPVFADTYGVAAALEYYGGRYGLPQPISAQNQYYLWGTRGYSLRTMLAVGASEYWMLKKLYRDVRMVGTFSDPYRWVVEGPTPIYFCSEPLVPVNAIWAALQWYGA